MTEQAEQPLLFEIIEDHIALVRINRPAARNAIDGAVAQALSNAVREIEANPQIRVAILGSTNPGMFCAGADLKVVAAGRVHELRPDDGGFAGFVDSIRAKPWIAMVDGPALGGGFELCLACDMIVATPGSRFALPEVKRGIMANAGGTHRVMRVLPRNIALEMVASGDPIDAANARHFGMINRIVPAENLLEETLALARSIMVNAPVSVKESMMLARISGDRTDAEMRRISRERMQVVMATEDSKEGPRAFVEKRSPNWKGQ